MRILVAVVGLVLWLPAVASAAHTRLDVAGHGLVRRDTAELFAGDPRLGVSVRVNGVRAGLRGVIRAHDGTTCAGVFARPGVRVTVSLCAGRRDRSDPVRITARNRRAGSVRVYVFY